MIIITMGVPARCLPLVACALIAVPLHASAGDLVVSHVPSAIHPGQVVQLVVNAPKDVSAVTVRWRDRDVRFGTEADGIWRALIGIDVAEEPGARSLRLTATNADATTASTTYAITVTPKAFRTRRITVDPKFVTPPDAEVPRILREAEMLNALLGRVSPDRLWTSGGVRPVSGAPVSGFGVRSVINGKGGAPHNGLDLSAATGTPVHAPTPGVVAYAGDLYYSGNTVILDHGQGLYSTMAHLSAIDVREGDFVAAGTLLGKVGATGRVTGPHLHWGVRLHGARVDPLSLLDALAATRATP